MAHRPKLDLGERVEPVMHAEATAAPSPAPAPVSLEVVHPSSQASARALYDDWVAIVLRVYTSDQPLPEARRNAVNDLISKTSAWMAMEPVDGLLRHLAQASVDESLVVHVVHTVMLSLVWCQEQGLPDDELRVMAWSALLHDVALKPTPVPELLRLSSDRSQASATQVSILLGTDAALQAPVQLVLSRLGAARGMHPALTPAEEKAAVLARALTRIDREEKLLRRRALWVASHKPVKKAI